jgi:hypothetical protein
MINLGRHGGERWDAGGGQAPPPSRQEAEPRVIVGKALDRADPRAVCALLAEARGPSGVQLRHRVRVFWGARAVAVWVGRAVGPAPTPGHAQRPRPPEARRPTRRASGESWQRRVGPGVCLAGPSRPPRGSAGGQEAAAAASAGRGLNRPRYPPATTRRRCGDGRRAARRSPGGGVLGRWPPETRQGAAVASCGPVRCACGAATRRRLRSCLASLCASPGSSACWVRDQRSIAEICIAANRKPYYPRRRRNTGSGG